MAYITDQEFERQQSESLARLMEAEKRAKALTQTEAKVSRKSNKHNKKELVKNGSK